MGDVKRTDRLREQIKEIVSEIIQRKLKDPHIGMVTITDVEVAKDLSEAIIYYSVFGDTYTRQASNKALDKAKGFIKGELGKVLQIRKVPTLRFEVDSSLDRGLRIQELLNQIGEIKPEDDESK